MDPLDSQVLAGFPAQEVSQEEIHWLGVAFDSELSLDHDPVVVVEVLLLLIGQAHQEPVLDLLALGQWTPGGVEALEDLLRIVRVVQGDGYHPEPLDALEQTGHVVSGHQPPGDAPRLRHRTWTARIAVEAATEFVFIFVLESELETLPLRHIGVGQVLLEAPRGPTTSIVAPQAPGDARQQDAHRR